MPESIQASTTKRITLHEDWTVVVLGFLIILLFLGGLLVPVPSFSWKTADDLFGKVLSLQN